MTSCMNIGFRAGSASPPAPAQANQPPAERSSAALPQESAASASTGRASLQASTAVGRGRQQQLLQSQHSPWSIENALAVPGQKAPKLSTRVRAALTREKLADLMAGPGKHDHSALTTEQMLKIAKNPHSAETFGWLTRKRIQSLMQNGFTTAQIVTIAGNDGARHVLEWLAQADNLARLTRDGEGKPLFTTAQIAAIAGNGGASGVLKWLAQDDNLARLTRGGDGKPLFTAAQIVSIAGNHGGKGVLEWLAQADNLARLTRGGDGKPLFTTAQIVSIAGNNGGKGVLEWLAQADNLAKLTRGGDGKPLFTIAQIAAIAGNDGARGVLEWLAQDGNLAGLSRDGDGKPLFTTEQIATLAGKGGAGKTLKEIAAKRWEGVLNKDEVFSLTSTNSGSGNLKWVLDHRDKLPAPGPRRDAILKLARSSVKGAKDKALALLSGTDDDAAAGPSSSGKRSKTAAGQGAGPAKRTRTKVPVVKQEAPEPVWNFPSSAMQEAMETVRLNTAQLLHVPVMRRAVIEVDAGGGHNVVVDIVRRDSDNAVIENQRQQTYNRDLEKRFAIRDPANPEHVHPLYAHPDDPTRVAPNVTIKGVGFYKAASSRISEKTLWQHAKKEKTPYRTQALYIAALKGSVKAEVQATIDGREPPSCQSIVIARIEKQDQCDSVEEYQATQGQYGAFLTDYAKDRQPSLRNARLGCLFAGARLASDADDAAYLGRTGAEFGIQMLNEYAAKRTVYGKQDQVTWAPHGGGNMAQYFNTSFEKQTIDGEDFLVCDKESATAMLAPLTLALTDKDGVARKESMLGIFLAKTVEVGKQPKLDYGDDYKIRCKAAQPDAMPIAPLIKRENAGDEDIAMTDA